MIDNLFLLAIGAFGWGLSLATYRLFARQQGWPMGSLHSDLPAVPATLGTASLAISLLFAAMRGTADGGGVIVLFGLLLAIFWTGFLRVGSQVSLVLAPVAALLLLIGWISVPLSDDGRRAGLEPSRFVTVLSGASTLVHEDADRSSGDR